MGAGKTTVGRRCATRLGRGFVDTDDLVVASAGVPFAEIFGPRRARPGSAPWSASRSHDAAASADPLVIACGGGAVSIRRTGRTLREAGFVVWLDASADAIGRAARPRRRPAHCWRVATGPPRSSASATRRARRVRGGRGCAHPDRWPVGGGGHRCGARPVRGRAGVTTVRVEVVPPYDVVVAPGALRDAGRRSRASGGWRW